MNNSVKPRVLGAQSLLSEPTALARLEQSGYGSYQLNEATKKMNIPFVDLRAQYAEIKLEVDAAVHRVLSNTSFILGKEAEQFEESFADFVNAKGAVGVASGTAALHLALVACGVGPGDEVITPAHTFMATAAPISQIGAKPVFVDIDADTYNLDPAHVEKAITSHTKAIIPVHLYGQPARLDEFRELASRYKLWLIEDAAQAHGAEYREQRCGSIGDVACFSFYPGKNLGAYGDAGAVTSNNAELLARVRKLRDHGRTSKYEHDEFGFGERLDGLQAAILSAKLPHLETWTEKRRAHARLYNDLLEGCDVITPYESSDVRHVYHLYVIRSPRRDAVLSHLKSKGIDAGIHYPIPLHRQPAYLKQGYGEVFLPVTEQTAREVLSLPMYAELTSEQISYVAEAVKESAQ